MNVGTMNRGFTHIYFSKIKKTEYCVLRVGYIMLIRKINYECVLSSTKNNYFKLTVIDGQLFCVSVNICFVYSSIRSSHRILKQSRHGVFHR